MLKCANHVQHIDRLSRATHRSLITCNTSIAYHVQHVLHAMWYEGTVQRLSLAALTSTHHQAAGGVKLFDVVMRGGVKLFDVVMQGVGVKLFDVVMRGAGCETV